MRVITPYRNIVRSLTVGRVSIRRNFCLKSLSLLVFAALSTVSFAAQITLGTNAITNPGAELGPGSATGNDAEAVPGWTTTGTFTVVQYGSPGEPVAAPGPGFGSNFFAGGMGTSFLPGTPGDTPYIDQATQFIDVSNISGLIDASAADYSLSGYFGGYLNQNDNASMFATFLNSSNGVIGTSATIGGFGSTARGGQSVLLYDSYTGLIPAGTSQVEITLVMTKVEGWYNDGYADNLSFIATTGTLPVIPDNGLQSTTPEPATFLLSGLGIGALFALRARNSRA